MSNIMEYIEEYLAMTADSEFQLERNWYNGMYKAIVGYHPENEYGAPLAALHIEYSALGKSMSEAIENLNHDLRVK